jgi:hypothetical protein
MKRKSRPKRSAPEECPNCGAEVPQNARACPECGSDTDTGWSEAAETSGLDLPDQDFDYQDFVNREFGTGGRASKKSWAWIGVALLLVVALLIFLLR